MSESLMRSFALALLLVVAACAGRTAHAPTPVAPPPAQAGPTFATPPSSAASTPAPPPAEMISEEIYGAMTYRGAQPKRSATARTHGASAGATDFGAAQPEAVFAQAATNRAATPNPDTTAQTASDGRVGPLLIYEGQFWMAVFHVEEKQKEVLAAMQALGGFLTLQTRSRMVVRVPAERFEEAVARLEGLGDVVDRLIRAEDVSDQFRDLTLRLRNAEEVRDRLASLLAQSDDVEKSLAIERELDRITERIELLKGQLKRLSDRIAFSTLTIEFGIKPQPQINSDFRLPFPWLNTLGLSKLLAL